MISFLASPKAFTGRNAEIQIRAIRSWLNVHPATEVILYGEHVSKLSDSLKSDRIRLVTEILSSASGVPRFDAIAEHAAKHALYKVHVYSNCDILFPPGANFLGPYSQLGKYLLVGQRVDLGKGVVFDINEPSWRAAVLRLAAAGQAQLHPATGIDYFAFPCGLWEDLPPLIIGRGGYDVALVAHCLRRRFPVVDVTFDVLALHQFHDYGHVSGGFKAAHFGSEAVYNYRTHDIQHSRPDIADADYQILHGRLMRSNCRGDALRKLELTIRFRWKLKYASHVLRFVWRLRKATGFGIKRDLDLNRILAAQSSVG